jgi:hypothetical protein
MGAITEESFKSCGFLVYRVDEPAQVDDIVGAAADIAFAGNRPVAVLLGQRLIGRKQWSR